MPVARLWEDVLARMLTKLKYQLNTLKVISIATLEFIENVIKLRPCKAAKVLF